MSTDPTVDTVHAARILRKARAFHTARGRVSAADRQLTQALHPSAHGTLTKDQRQRITLARDLIRSVTPDLRTLADVNPPPPSSLAAALTGYHLPAPFVPKAVPPVHGNVVQLAARRRT